MNEKGGPDEGTAPLRKNRRPKPEELTEPRKDTTRGDQIR